MTTHMLLHPSLAMSYARQRHQELEAEARSFRIAARESSPNTVERFFIKRREGKVTWIETVLVQRSA